MGDGRMIETARNPHCPKVSLLSTFYSHVLTISFFQFKYFGVFFLFVSLCSTGL